MTRKFKLTERHKLSKSADIIPLNSMRKDFCVKCGSEDLVIHEKEIEFNFPNPGRFAVNQECKECLSCGEIYFNSKQMNELSLKIKDAIKK